MAGPAEQVEFPDKQYWDTKHQHCQLCLISAPLMVWPVLTTDGAANGLFQLRGCRSELCGCYLMRGLSP